MRGDRVSDPLALESGVPEGGVSSPLWTAAIADMRALQMQMVLYADDCYAVVTAASAEDAERQMNAALVQYSKYARTHRLTPAADKSYLLIVGPRRGAVAEACDRIRCCLDGVEVERVRAAVDDTRSAGSAGSAGCAG